MELASLPLPTDGWGIFTDTLEVARGWSASLTAANASGTAIGSGGDNDTNADSASSSANSEQETQIFEFRWLPPPFSHHLSTTHANSLTHKPAFFWFPNRKVRFP